MRGPLRYATACGRGEAVMHIDLLPTHSIDQVRAEVSRPAAHARGQKPGGRLGCEATSSVCARIAPKAGFDDPATLAPPSNPAPDIGRGPPIAIAISTAGGVCADSIYDT